MRITFWNTARVLLASLCAVILVLGCGRKPADIRVTPEQVSFSKLGTTHPIKAEVFDKKGRPLKDCKVEWMSSNPSVAEVVGEGVILSKGKGVAKISVTSGKVTDEISVNVLPISSLKVMPDSVTLFRIGATRPMKVEVLDEAGKPAEDAPVAWSSANPSVASTTDSGVISAVGAGDTKVTARVLDTEVSARVIVRPVDLPDKLVKMIRKCLTCKTGSLCKVAVKDESFFYLLEIDGNDLKIVDLVENKGQSVWNINDELSKRGMEICRGVWVYGGKFGAGMSNWTF